jgi:hypothetical protein
VNARQVDDATTRLHDLQIEGIGDLALAVVATGLALTATQLRPVLAIPFLLGAFGVGFLGLRAYVRRTFLVEDLAVDPDAYTIPAVRRFGLRVASPAHRHDLADAVRMALTGSSGAVADRYRAVQPELQTLIVVLEEDDRRLDPCAVVTLEHWLNDPGGSFRDQDVPVAELRSRLRSELIELDPGVIP